MKNTSINPEIDKILDKLSDMDVTQIDEVLADLDMLRKAVEKTRVQAERKSRKDALSHVESVAANLGFTLDELLDNGSGRKRSKAGPKTISQPKYVNPDNQSETWTGRGRLPNWLKQLIDQGRSRDEFLIDKT